MEKDKKLEWNVYRYDVNAKKIYVFNIFEHGSFIKYFRQLCNTPKKEMTREYFNKKLKNELMFYFWSKCEHEIIVAPWIGSDDAAIKVDIYDQVMNNWEHFSDYVWKWYKENLNDK